jgi:hypothetical protein
MQFQYCEIYDDDAGVAGSHLVVEAEWLPTT